MKARIGILKARLRLGRQTIAYPDGPARFPERFRGRPVLDPARCPAGCDACASACPTEAIAAPGRPEMALDLGRCLFCADCLEACPAGALTFTRDYRLATRTREALQPAPHRSGASTGRPRKRSGNRAGPPG